MANSPIMTVQQALELEPWLEQRERELRGKIRNLEHNLSQVRDSRDYWHRRHYESEYLPRTMKFKARRRLIPLVKLIIKV